MLHTLTTRSRYRLVAAVTAVLAVTTVGPATPAGATAVPAGLSAAPATAEQDVAPFPLGARILSSGPTGFLSAQTTSTGTVHRWTRYADGVTTVLPSAIHVGSAQTDLVTSRAGTVYTVRDMATGAAPLVIDTGGLVGTYAARGLAGSTLVLTAPNATGGTGLHLVSKPQDTVLDHKVAGLPEDAVLTRVDTDSPDAVVVLYTGTVAGVKQSRIAVVDVATHTVVEDYATEQVTSGSETALSATHLAWVEKTTAYPATLVTVRRDTGELRREPLYAPGLRSFALVGDWLTYGHDGSTGSTDSYTLYPLRARSLTTGETVTLLPDLANAAPGYDGTQIVRGGSVASGEGLYRIAPGADGASPTVTLVASTGEPSVLEVVKETVPTTIDFDRVTAPVPMSWTLSSNYLVDLSLTLTHSATKKSWQLPVQLSGGSFQAKWNGLFPNSVTAYNGEYTWEFVAVPLRPIGPTVRRTGTFTVTRKPTAHDFNDNGTSDLLVRDGGGLLRVYDGNQTLRGPSTEELEAPLLGADWNAYDRLVAPGNLGGSPYADIVTRDKSGVLWLHQGNGRTLAPRVAIGGGWGVYNQLTGGSDLNGDGRTDLVATDKAGDLYLYKGTGNATAPFAPRKKIGFGWGIYNKVTATGDIAGAPAGDLLARDKAGALWLYLGNGDGTYAPRIRVGAGWQGYSDVVGIGDADRDGILDLMAYDATTDKPYFYKGTGSWRAPFGPRTLITNAYGMGRNPLTWF